MVEETEVRARRKFIPPVRDPRRKCLVYGATYLVPRAGIEPTPHTDMGYRPVSQTRKTRRKPLGHDAVHVAYKKLEGTCMHVRFVCIIIIIYLCSFFF
jgi:hypothetical protein